MSDITNETKPTSTKQDTARTEVLKTRVKQGIANSRVMARQKQTALVSSSKQGGKPNRGGGGCGAGRGGGRGGVGSGAGRGKPTPVGGTKAVRRRGKPGSGDTTLMIQESLDTMYGTTLQESSSESESERKRGQGRRGVCTRGGTRGGASSQAAPPTQETPAAEQATGITAAEPGTSTGGKTETGRGKHGKGGGKLGTRGRKGITVRMDSSSKRKAGEERVLIRVTRGPGSTASSENNGAQDQPAQRDPGMGKNMKLVMKAVAKSGAKSVKNNVEKKKPQMMAMCYRGTRGPWEP